MVWPPRIPGPPPFESLINITTVRIFYYPNPQVVAIQSWLYMAAERVYRLGVQCLLSLLVIHMQTLMQVISPLSIGNELMMSNASANTTYYDNINTIELTEVTKKINLVAPFGKNGNSIPDEDWEYWGPHGEHHWDKSFKSCKGKSQSPINIETNRIVYLPDLQLSFINFDRALSSLKLVNNGHTIKMEPSHMTGKQFQCFVTGNALFGQTYRFLQLHFHWRNAHSAGSEHAIDGEKFSMEMHVVFQNIKYDKETNTETVLRQSDAFTVIAVFFDENNVHNWALDPVIEHLDMVTNVHDFFIMNNTIRLETLLPAELTRFYRYSGSYTTPGCQEVVTWIIFPDPQPIDAEQMQRFDDLILHVVHADGTSDGTSGKGAKLSFTHMHEQFLGFYRHIQEIGTRRIYAPEGMQPDAGIQVTASLGLVLFSTVLAMIVAIVH